MKNRIDNGFNDAWVFLEAQYSNADKDHEGFQRIYGNQIEAEEEHVSYSV